MLLPFRGSFGLCVVRLLLAGACGEGGRKRGRNGWRAAPNGDDGEAFFYVGSWGHSW